MNEKAYCHLCGKKTYIISCDKCGGFGEVTECCGIDDFETTGEQEKCCARCGYECEGCLEKDIKKALWIIHYEQRRILDYFKRSAGGGTVGHEKSPYDIEWLQKFIEE